MAFRVLPRTATYPDGPPHFGKTEERFYVEGGEMRFTSEAEAEALADRLNLALDPLNSFDEKGNALVLNV